MKNTHLEHPEDSILSGDLTVLDWFTSIDNDISAKIDGSPAIVWGTEPKTGKFFVGTKSVFNKKLIKINYCLLYTSPSPRDRQKSRMPSSA